MATTKKTGIKTSKKVQSSNKSSKSTYIYGSTVRKIYPQPDIKKQLKKPIKKNKNVVKRNRTKAKYMDLPYVITLITLTIITSFILINYIELQAELTNKIRIVSRLKVEVNNLRLINDDNLSKIESELDLEEIKWIAIGELHMQYPDSSQIVVYDTPQRDYMKKIK